jgi:hypothetical protein
VDIAGSVNGVPIRLTDERWEHIVSNRPYMEPYYERVLQSVETPTWILRGYGGVRVAVVPLGRRTYLHTVYREVSRSDGFILTAYVSREVNRRKIVWPERP